MRPRGPKWIKAPQKPHIVQNDTFCLVTFHLSDFSETLPECRDNCYGPCKPVVHVPRGLLVLKTPFLGDFRFVQNVLKISIQWFYGAEFKFMYPNT